MIGLFLFLSGTIGCFILQGGHAAVLLKCVPFMGIVAASLGNAIVAFGLKDVVNATLTIRFLFTDPPEPAPKQLIAVVRFLIVSFYVTSGLMALFALLIALASVHESMTAWYERTGVVLILLAYPVLISECLLRPLKHRLESHAGACKAPA